MKYIFTEEQFITLLVLAGQKSLYMFSREEDLDDSAIVHAVAQLYRRKQAMQSGGRIVLTGEVMELVRVMGLSEYIIKLTLREGVPGQQLIYPGAGGQGPVIVLEKQSGPGRPQVKLWPAEPEAYVRDLFDNEQLPRSLTEHREEAMALEGHAQKDLEAGHEEMFFEAERIRAEDGERDNRILGFRSLVFPWLDVLCRDVSYCHMYSAEEAAGLLLKEIRGEEL